MTVGELKKLIESENFSDDFEIDIMGENSGSFGGILRIDKRIQSLPSGSDYKELQLFIDA